MKLIVVAAVLASSALGCDAASTRCAHVAAPVSIEGQRPLTVRAEAGVVWTSTHAWAEARRAWAMPAQGPVEDVALRTLPNGGFAVFFRQGGTVWRGDLDSERQAVGPLRALLNLVDVADEDRVSTR